MMSFSAALHPEAALQPALNWPDQSALHTQAALARALDLIEKQQQRIIALESEAQTDPMTGVLNQRGFYKALSREVDRAKRQDKTSALLVLFDLDGLKQINDTHGHQAGDAYIQSLADGLASVRLTDYVGRLGGDEFALLLTDAEPEAALNRVMRLVAQLNDRIAMHDGSKFTLQVSHGSVAVAPGQSAVALIAKADKELYQLKAQRKQAKLTPERPR